MINVSLNGLMFSRIQIFTPPGRLLRGGQESSDMKCEHLTWGGAMRDFVQTCTLGIGPVTVAVKDSIDIAGLPTMAGSRSLADAPAARTHATVVQAVLNAGCRIVGKTVLHEFAFGMTGVNPWAGTPVNPKFPDLVPGGSSSGSATAVAGGRVDFAIGTDTGGSVRLPAACCSIFGFKPTFGRIDRSGAIPAATSLDCIGPLAGTMDMLIRAMMAMDPSFKNVNAPAGLPRLGLVAVTADPTITTAIANAVTNSGAPAEAVSLPSLTDSFTAGLVIINAETWAACGGYLATGKVGPDVATRLEKARLTTASDLAIAEAVRQRFTAEVDAALATVDALVLPTLPGFPMSLADALAGKVDLTASALVRPFNLSGHPALSIPLPAVQGRPVSLQIVGRKGDDEGLCAIAQRLVPLFAADQKQTSGD